MASVTLADLAANLQARADAIKGADFTRPLKTIRWLIIADVKANFRDQHDPDGTPWEPLKRPRPGGLILRDTGVLMASVTAAGVGSIDELWARGLRVGTSIDYAGIQNFGGTIEHKAGPRKLKYRKGKRKGTTVSQQVKSYSVTIPARRFLGVGDALRGKIDGILAKFVAGLMKGQDNGG